MKLIILTPLLALLVWPCGGQDPLTRQVDQLFARWDRADSPGAAVVIVKDGAVVYRHGYGCANLEHRIPITPETVFDAASVAKQFTGLAVAMVAGQGQLPLEDDIHKYLPVVPDFGKPITLQHLLHHTSGLRDWSEAMNLMGVADEDVVNLDTILEFVRRQRDLDFPPGDDYDYSNTGYNLLALTVAKVSGQPFPAWMEANVFQPLGMKHTHVCHDPAEAVSNRADSYAPAGQQGFRRVVSQLAAPGSSSLMTTADDLGQWLLNFETARVGGKAALEAMHQPGKSNAGTNVDYGFGVNLKEYRGAREVQHTGKWAGYRSVVMRIPEHRFGVAILANAANMVPSGLATNITDLYLGDVLEVRPAPSPARTPAAVKPDPAAWESFLGTYRLGPGWLLTITREDKQLMVQATREARVKMTPLSDTTFFVETYGGAIEFVRENPGSETRLVYRGIHAPKVHLPVVTPDKLAAYAGDYWSDELGVVYRIEMRDGQLAMWLRPSGWVRLLPTGPDQFDSEAECALQFTRDSAAKVTGMSLTGERVRHLRFTRVALPQR